MSARTQGAEIPVEVANSSEEYVNTSDVNDRIASLRAIVAPGGADASSRMRASLLRCAGLDSDALGNIGWDDICSPCAPLPDLPTFVETVPPGPCPRNGCSGKVLPTLGPVDSRSRQRSQGFRKVSVLTESGFRTLWLGSNACDVCDASVYPYFWIERVATSSKCGHMPGGPWRCTQTTMPRFLMLSQSLCIETAFAKKLDARMLHCPFEWRSLSQEYAELYGKNDDVYKNLHHGWQIYVIFALREACVEHSVGIPPCIDVSPNMVSSTDSTGRKYSGGGAAGTFNLLIRIHLPCLRKLLQKTAITEHRLRCTNMRPDICETMNITDGDSKVYRSICPVVCDEIIRSSTLRRQRCLPCGEQPRKRFRTCEQHKHHAVEMPRAKARAKAKSHISQMKQGRVVSKRPAAKRPAAAVPLAVAPPARRRRLRSYAEIDALHAAAEQDCKTRKDTRDLRWHKSRGILCTVYPCGIISDVREMYTSESLLQVAAMLEEVREVSEGKISRFGYDDGCHLHDSLSKAAREGSQAARDFLDRVDIFIDSFHLKGHKRERCKLLFDPATRPYADKQNTQAAEHAWRYLNRHRHSLRFANQASFALRLLWVVVRRNMRVR